MHSCFHFRTFLTVLPLAEQHYPTVSFFTDVFVFRCYFNFSKNLSRSVETHLIKGEKKKLLEKTLNQTWSWYYLSRWTKANAPVTSSSADPSPALARHLLTFKSRGWGIWNFTTTRAAGHGFGLASGRERKHGFELRISLTKMTIM